MPPRTGTLAEMSDPATAFAAGLRPPPRPGWSRAALLGGAAALLLAGAAEAARVWVGDNVHRIRPGLAYRSAQLTPAKLRRVITDHGVRTVVNLRGCANPFDWYLDECRTTHALDVNQEDVCLSASRLPPPAELRRLVEVFDRTEYPVLIHCRRGIDRTGLAAAVFLLLHTDADLPAARRQLGLRYGHVAIGRTANMHAFLDLYEDWLDGWGVSHAPELF